MNVYPNSPVESLVELLGMEVVKMAAWRAAQNAEQQGREWGECPKTVYSDFEFEHFVEEALDDLREAEWAGENDIAAPITESFLDDCYLVFHECLNGVDVNRSCGDGTYETIEENITMFYDEWEALDKAATREVIRDILEGIRD